MPQGLEILRCMFCFYKVRINFYLTVKRYATVILARLAESIGESSYRSFAFYKTQRRYDHWHWKSDCDIGKVTLFQNFSLQRQVVLFIWLELTILDSVQEKMALNVEPKLGIVWPVLHALESDISIVTKPWNLGLSMNPWSRLIWGRWPHTRSLGHLYCLTSLRPTNLKQYLNIHFSDTQVYLCGICIQKAIDHL